MIIYEVPSNVRVRAYQSVDAEATLRIFQDATMVTALQNYTPAQLNAWAGPEQLDLTECDRSMLRRKSFVATPGNQVAGFSDISEVCMVRKYPQ